MRTLLCLKGATPTDDVTLTDAEQKQLSSTMWQWLRRSPRAWLAFGIITLAPIAFFTIFAVVYYNLLESVTPNNPIVRALFPLVIHIIGGSLLVVLGFYLAIRCIWEPQYRKALHDLGYDLCDRCDYRLDGIDSDAPCPECGAARTAEVEDHHQNNEPRP